MSSAAEIKMDVGVHLRSEVIDTNGAPSDFVQTGGALRVQAANFGVVSFQNELSTRAIGGAATDRRGQDQWTSHLILPAVPKIIDQHDVELKVTKPKQPVAFRTVARLRQLIPDETSPYGIGYYESAPLDVFAKTS